MGVKCQDGNDGNVFNFSVNRTLNIDSTDPVISVLTVNQTTSDTTPQIVFTATDSNLASVSVFTNFSGTWQANYTNLSVSSGVQANYFNTTAIADGVYVWSARASDSAGRNVETVNYSLIIDTTMPTISVVTNVSVIDKCDQRNITFTTSELTNSTLTYDTDTDLSDGTVVVSSSTKTTSHGLVLDFDYNGEITYYFNITTTDVAGNDNRTNGQTIFQTPARVCAGWSQYAVYDSLINLSVIQNQSGADLVYFWNATNQDWVFKTAGLSTNDGVDVGFKTDYHVVHLFEDTNSTWYRNTSNSGVFDYNVTSVNNFINVPIDYTFGNLTESFMNGTVGFPTHISNFTGGSVPNGTFIVINLTSFSGYNNSIQDYVNHIFNFTWSNSTLLEPCPDRNNKDTCMETFWVASAFNVTWSGVQVTGNWSI